MPLTRSVRSLFRIILPANILCFGYLCVFLACTGTKKSGAARGNSVTPFDTSSVFYSLADFNRVEKIDAHVHVFTSGTFFLQQAEADNFRLLTINVEESDAPPIGEQEAICVRQLKAFPGRIAYATALPVRNWNNPDWQEQTISWLEQSFSKGAIAVKIYKNVGMELKDKEGKLVMADNPKFDPILDYLEKNRIPLIGHLGEPRNCWLPIEKMTVNGDKKYYAGHPEYHMYLHPEFPSYEEQISARDHLLDKHPGLHFIGAHLGSLEWSVDELAKELDRYPNMVVDMAARISHFQYQAITDWQKVHDFFIRYQDRLLYATDRIAEDNNNTPAFKKSVHEAWLNDWAFFVTDERMTRPGMDSAFSGLKLPGMVIDKIYRKNAEKWFGNKI
ncbi:amidohydrolase family protein [Flavitalea flava]